MGRHHKPRRDRLGGKRSGDLGRHIYVSYVGVGGGGDGGDLGVLSTTHTGYYRVQRVKRLPPTYDYIYGERP